MHTVREYKNVTLTENRLKQKLRAEVLFSMHESISKHVSVISYGNRLISRPDYAIYYAILPNVPGE